MARCDHQHQLRRAPAAPVAAGICRVRQWVALLDNGPDLPRRDPLTERFKSVPLGLTKK